MNESHGITNALSIDVEDYFQVSAFEKVIDRASWDGLECRVERNVELILSLLEQHRTHATFFTLGWMAERYPAMVRTIAAAGHEVASHGYGHARVTDLTPARFTDDITRAKHLLEDTTGVQVKGYRAPSFSVGPQSLWALPCIRDAGYRYSSSIYPVKHDHYGMPDAPRFAYQPIEGLTEVPITTTRWMQRNLPVGGGGYFRLLPYPVSRWGLQRVNRLDQRPCVFYFHPWEVDPGQPRVAQASLKSKFRHYINLKRTLPRLDRLLTDFRWDRIDRAVAGLSS